MVFSIYELITAFTAGLFLLYLLTFFLRLKRKFVLVLASNSLIGTAFYVIASFIWGFSASAILEMFLCGFAGVLGCAVLALIKFL